MNFASDNTAPVAPAIMEAIVKANRGACAAYGTDDESRAASALLCEVFETAVSVYFLSSGTATNSLGLAGATPPYGTILCSDVAHIHLDECGAPEFFTGGAKLQPIESKAGKLLPSSVEEVVRQRPPLGPHRTPMSVLSLTQATEAGTIYSTNELAALAAVAREHNMRVHVDGARFANAVVASGATPAELSWKAGVDILSFGATKNGCMAAEALLIFDPSLCEAIEFRRKRAGHLWSKGRYLGAQFAGYLANDTWLDLAGHANAMASRLASGLAALDDVSLAYPCQINEVFVHLPAPLARALSNAGAMFYPWVCPGLGPEAQVYRFITSWSTTQTEVDDFLALAGKVADEL